jgi:hypothetical protein
MHYCPTDAMIADYITKRWLAPNSFISQSRHEFKLGILVQQECIGKYRIRVTCMNRKFHDDITIRIRK